MPAGLDEWETLQQEDLTSDFPGDDASHLEAHHAYHVSQQKRLAVKGRET